MKNYTITVNGNSYDVTVEEKGSTSTPAPAATPTPTAPAAKMAKSGNAGSVQLKAPMPGKVLTIPAEVGDEVKKGDTVLVFEAMKMENSAVAQQDGTIASIDVKIGDEFEAGAVLATMN